MAGAGGCGTGAGPGPLGIAWLGGGFWPGLLMFCCGTLGVMGVAGVGASFSLAGSAAGVAPAALRLGFDFF